MPKATKEHTTSRPRLPLGDEFAGTIAQLKALADRSTDAALSEGPVSPDRVLLDLCAAALHLLRHAGAMEAEWRASDRHSADVSAAEKTRLAAVWEEAQDLERQARRSMWRAKKLQAQTPAGIYAKAMLVRCSKTGAADMAMSLAEDMVACRSLRELLWAPEAMAGVGD